MFGFWNFWMIKKFFCSKSLRMVQFVKINGFKGFLIFFPSQWVTRLPDLVIFWRILKMKSLSIFTTLARWIYLILQILIVLIVLDHLRTSKPDQNYAKWGQFGRKKVKIWIFDYFFEFECLIVLDIADYDCTLICLMVRSIFQVGETRSRESSNNNNNEDNDGEGSGDN